MQEKIEEIKTKVDSIKTELEKVRKNVKLSATEKLAQAKALNDEAEDLKSQQEVSELLKREEEAESDKVIADTTTLSYSFGRVAELYNEIISSRSAEATPTVQAEDEKKGFFKQIGDWFSEKWQNFKDKDTKEKRRTVGLVGASGVIIGLGYKLSKYFSKEAIEERRKKREAEREAKRAAREAAREERRKEIAELPFWKRPIVRFLTRTGIVTIAGGAIYSASKISKGNKENTETIHEGGDTISEAMFQELLYAEGSQDFVAKIHKDKFGEDFVTGPYGMTMKHIDENGNPLKKPIPFKNGERVSKEWAENNARVYYNKQAKQWATRLKGKEYNQDMLDALVSASGGTKKSVDRLKKFVLSHRDDKDAIFDFMSKFATTAAGNGKIMKGLVIRRDFEANWFRGNKEPLSEYQRRYQKRYYA